MATSHERDGDHVQWLNLQKKGNHHEVVDLFKELQSKGADISITQHNMYIVSLYFLDRVDAFWEHIRIVRKMKKGYFTPRTMDAVVSICIQTQETDALLAWLRYFFKWNNVPGTEKVYPHPMTMQTVMEHLVMGEKEGLFKVLNILKRNTGQRTAFLGLSFQYKSKKMPVWAYIWDHHINQNEHEHLIELFGWIARNEYIGEQIPTAIVQVFEDAVVWTERYDQALFILQRMKKSGSLPYIRPHTLMKMLQYYRDKQRWQTMMDVLQMKKTTSSWEFSKYSWAIMLEALTHMNQIHKMQNSISTVKKASTLDDEDDE